MYEIMLLLVTLLRFVSCNYNNNTLEDIAAQQLLIFKEVTQNSIGILTTTSGEPIEQRYTSTLNRNLIEDQAFMDSIGHLSRERIPERVVHAKGAGAFGYFEVTHDISNICKAKLFSQVGKKVPVAVRFSLVAANTGGADISRDIRGFAVKFYTEEGNFDIVGLNIPIFSVKDPFYFPSFVRAQKKNPATNLFDQNMIWDFFTLRPESLFLLMYRFSSYGTPAGFRHMSGFGIHTYQVYNEYGESFYVRFHFNTDIGIKNLDADESMKIAGEDPDYATKDLYNSISNGNFPSWTVRIQVLTLEDVRVADFDVFDVTKELPVDKYPLQPLGKLVLNTNAKNYFAEIEQLAFNPSNLVPGILGGPDKLFEARRLSYKDTQRYRLGGNFHNIPVNCPLYAKIHNYDRDGRPPVKDNMGDSPNYYPNSFNGPEAYVDHARPELLSIYQDSSLNFEQISNFYTYGLSEFERISLISNILQSLRSAAIFLQDRTVKLLAGINSDLANRVAEGLMVYKKRSTINSTEYRTRRKQINSFNSSLNFLK